MPICRAADQLTCHSCSDPIPAGDLHRAGGTIRPATPTWCWDCAREGAGLEHDVTPCNTVERVTTPPDGESEGLTANQRRLMEAASCGGRRQARLDEVRSKRKPRGAKPDEQQRLW